MNQKTKFKNKIFVKFASVLLSLMIILSLIPMTLFAAVKDDTNYDTLVFTSDIHNKSGNVSANRLATWLGTVSTAKNDLFDTIGTCGDNADAQVNQETYWNLAKVSLDTMDNSEYIVQTPGVYVCGNHEWSPGNISSARNNNDVAKRIAYGHGAARVDNDYIIYDFGATNNNQTFNQSDITALGNYLSTVDGSKPIFILSHFPLHDEGSRRSVNKDQVISTINQYGEGKTIIFLWGHTHTDAQYSEKNYDKVFSVGDTLGNSTLNFTYAAAGCMSDTDYSGGSASVKGKGMVASIKNSTHEVTLQYFDLNGKAIGSPVTAKKGSGVQPPVSNYTVSYSFTGTVPPNVSAPAGGTYKAGDVVSVPSVNAVSGYTFEGWKLNGTTVNRSFNMPSSNVTLTGNWTKNAVETKYKVTYVFTNAPSGAKVPSAEEYKTGDTVYVPSVASVSGYTFEGWEYEGTRVSRSFTMPSKNVTVTGTWSKDPNPTYSVTYKFDGEIPSDAVLPSENNYTAGTTVTLPYVNAVSGYTFEGWKLNGTTLSRNFTMPSNNVTITGTWSKNAPVVKKYKVTYRYEGAPASAEAPAGGEYEVGGLVYLPTPAAIDRYEFAGWRLEGAGVTGSFKMPDHDVNVIGMWNKNEDPATTLSLNKSSLNLLTANSEKLIATVSPKQDVLWTVSDPLVAKVDKNGVVEALRYGKATITATTADGKANATCELQTRYYDVPDPITFPGYAVYWAADKGITKGYDNVYFGPEKTCTRTEFAIFVWRLAGKPSVSGTLQFTDCNYDESSDSYKAILWASRAGIVKGYSDGTFGPKREISRLEAMIMLYRYYDKPVVSGITGFSDVDGQFNVTTDSYKSILWGTKNGITNGYSDGTFGVNKPCQRQAVVAFMYRAEK